MLFFKNINKKIKFFKKLNQNLNYLNAFSILTAGCTALGPSAGGRQPASRNLNGQTLRTLIDKLLQP